MRILCKRSGRGVNFISHGCNPSLKIWLVGREDGPSEGLLYGKIFCAQLLIIQDGLCRSVINHGARIQNHRTVG